MMTILQTIKNLFPRNATRFYSSNLGQEIGDLNAPVIVMTLGGGGRGDRQESFVKEYLKDQRQFVILCFPVGGKFAITAHVDILVLFLQKGRGEAGRAQISKRNERGNIRTAVQIAHIPTKQLNTDCLRKTLGKSVTISGYIYVTQGF